jgi:hypothetical protein
MSSMSEKVLPRGNPGSATEHLAVVYSVVRICECPSLRRERLVVDQEI